MDVRVTGHQLDVGESLQGQSTSRMQAIAELPGVVAREAQARWALVAFHAALFGGAILALGDTLSAIFGALFLLVLRRKGCRVFYLIMGVLVLYIELVGTALGCWFWEPAPWGVLRTTNPPVGAFVCYVIADILVIKIAVRVVTTPEGRWHPTKLGSHHLAGNLVTDAQLETIRKQRGINLHHWCDNLTDLLLDRVADLSSAASRRKLLKLADTIYELLAETGDVAQPA